MGVLQVTLTEQNGERLDALSRRTGRTPDELANEAVERLEINPAATGATDAKADVVPEWKAAIMQAAGMWKDRDDIPELMAELRREWNRNEPADRPL